MGVAAVGRKAVAVGRGVAVAVGVQVGGQVGRGAAVAGLLIASNTGVGVIASAWQAQRHTLMISKASNRRMRLF